MCHGNAAPRRIIGRIIIPGYNIHLLCPFEIIKSFKRSHQICGNKCIRFHTLYSIALDSIPDGATIAIPNDTTNESRALGLLEFNGLINLDTEAGQTATVLDIAENPHKFDFVEVEAAQVPRTLADVDLGVINSNYALQAGVDVVGTPIAYESTEVAYPNIIAVREGDDREELKTLVEVLQSDEIVNFINETYKGAVVPTK